MNELLWMGGSAFLGALILTPIVRDIFRTYNVVDKPGQRKVHVYPIPRAGGIPIAIAYVLTLYFFLPADGPVASMAWNIIPGAALIFLTGLIDDFINLKPLVKLAGQTAAAGLVAWSGVRIEEVAGTALPIWLSVPLTIFWLLLCTNALNLIDGLDGLCAGMGLLATLTLFGVAMLHHNTPLAYATFPMAGALLGFLCYNFNPATIFLGDSGALLIGFLLGCYGMIWTQKSATLISMIVPLLALSIPLLDVSLSVLRRFIRRQPIFSADRGHIHHRLLDMGLSPRRAVLVLYLLASLAAAFGFLLSAPNLGRFQSILIVAFCVAAWFGIRQLRYAEFGMLQRLVFRGEFHRAININLRLDRLVASLDATSTDDAWWEAVTRFAEETRIATVEWARGTQILKQVQNKGEVLAWTLIVQLSEEETLRLGGAEIEEDSQFLDLIALSRVLRESRATRRQEQEVNAS